MTPPESNHPQSDVALDATMPMGLGAPPVAPNDTFAPVTGGGSEGAPAQVPVLLAGRWEILAMLGAGGMGAVYKARDRELGELVALKMLLKDLASNAQLIERFKAEVKLARRVTHRNVARTYDIGEQDGARFLTMELLDGVPLSTLLRRDGPMSPARVTTLAIEICAGLSAAHSAGVVHRDLKPDNVFETADGRVVITDFGIARAVREGRGEQTPGCEGRDRTGALIVGTPAYMAPEQVEGAADLDGRADLFALGAMCFELLTGTWPWESTTALGLAMARLIEPPRELRTLRADVPDSLARVVMRCLERDRTRRFATAGELAGALTSLTRPIEVTPVRSAPAGPQPAAPSDLLRAVAVLPLRNQGPQEDAFVAEGLTDDLTDSLSMTAGLRVVPRSRVERETASATDPLEIGRALGVAVVVDGSVRRLGAQARVTARLLSVEDGFQLWARRFDVPATELLRVGDDIARAVAEGLTVDLALPERAAPTDPAAIDLYLRARAKWRTFVHENTAEAVELFEQALKLAPTDAAIVSGLALARVRLWFHAIGDSAGLERAARDAAEMAVQVAPRSGDAHLALATLRLHAGDAPGAMRALRHALAQAPALASAHELVGAILGEVGRVEDSLRWLESSLRLAPDSMVSRVEMARILALLGRFGEAEQIYATLLLGAPPAIKAGLTQAYGRLLFWQGRTGEALRRLDDPGLPDVQPVRRAMHRLPERVHGASERARVFEELAAKGGASVRRALLILQVETELAARYHDPEWAFDALARATAAGLMDVSWMDRCPMLAELRAHPRFAPLRARVAAIAKATIEAWES